MALTYTEVEQEKNNRIYLFFLIVLLFYLFIAIILANLTKAFFTFYNYADSPYSARRLEPFLTAKEHLYLLVFAGVAAFLHITYSLARAVSLIQGNLRVENIDNSDKYHQRFNVIVDEVNVATGSKYRITPVVIPTVAMNAFAMSDRRKNAILGVTEGLLSRLNRDQLQAVVAHEVAHIASGDSFQTTVGCSLFGIYAAILSGMKRIFSESRIRTSGRGGGIILFLLLIFVVLSIMQLFYLLIRLILSRNRELRADAIAVRLTRDPVSLSEALYSISLGWRGMGKIDEGLEPLFIMNPVKAAIDEKEGFIANLFSTHPPVRKRIEILTGMAHASINQIEEAVISGERLKERFRQASADASAAAEAADVKITGLKRSSFNCPRCKEALFDDEYEGAIAQRCISCGGILVEKEKIERIIIRQEKGFSERVKRLAELTQKDGLVRIGRGIKEGCSSFLKCPRCAVTMTRSFYTMAYLVEVDQCYSCNLIWLDKDELEILQYLIEEKKVADITKEGLI